MWVLCRGWHVLINIRLLAKGLDAVARLKPCAILACMACRHKEARSSSEIEGRARPLVPSGDWRARRGQVSCQYEAAVGYAQYPPKLDARLSANPSTHGGLLLERLPTAWWVEG